MTQRKPNPVETLTNIHHLSRKLLIFASLLGLAYGLGVVLVALRQRHLIYRPHSELSTLPSNPDFQLPYKDVWIQTTNVGEQMHGWWFPATAQAYVTLPQEPKQVLTSPKTILYFCGVGRNMGDYNYLARVAAFRQLGFSVLVFDYRGYGRSDGDVPHESQLYEDAKAAWNYLQNIHRIQPQNVLLYGESLGGAIALDLAVRYPKAGGLIMQSSFTSMGEAIQSRSFSRFIPTDLILTEHFDSLSKIRSLEMPVLFLHGKQDSVVPFVMSQHLYDAAPEPKQLVFISDADHVRIYQSGEESYIRAIATFVKSLSW